MTPINIQFTLFSAFYSPLISTMSGGFLRDEGLDASWSVAPAGVSALDAVANGTAHVVQSAPSQGITDVAAGRVPGAAHFAQVNEMDGFFLTAREPDPDFRWSKLEGASVVLFGGGQPLAMFKYACHRAGIDFARLDVINVGGAADMDSAFRAGKGQYVQQQGPFPQQLEADGVGHVVAQVGVPIGSCAFSSLAATRDWLATDMARAFTRAYARTRVYMNETPAQEIASAQASYFPNIDQRVLANCIGTYQQLGCWTPHVEITREAFDATLDIYAYNGAFDGASDPRPAWENVCAAPPSID